MSNPRSIEIVDMPTGLLEAAFPHLGDTAIDPANLGFAPEIGFIAVKSSRETAAGTMQLLGVYTSSAPQPELPPGDTLVVPSDPTEVGPEYRTADRIGKGVLGRFWNTEQASRGWIDDPRQRGLYAFDVDPARLHFVTEPFSGGAIQAAKRIMSHKALRKSERHSALTVVADYTRTRSGYGAAQAIFMTEPPRPKVRRLLRGAWGVPKDMSASFIAPLNKGATAQRVGVIRR